jgi:proteic killer suppression protein
VRRLQDAVQNGWKRPGLLCPERLLAAISLADLGAIRGNRLEPLKGERAGQHSIRVNDQWRICFVWREGSAHEVEIADYH